MKKISFVLLAFAALCAAFSCQKKEEDYLVRETDLVNFDTPQAQSRNITLRCLGAWKTVVPQGAEWISTTPSEGVGEGKVEYISINVEANRGGERTATIYLENGGWQYPVTVTQVDGAVVWSTALTAEGELTQGEAGQVVLTLPYSNAMGDETVALTCEVTGDAAQGLAAEPVSAQLQEGSGVVNLTVAGTPVNSGLVTFGLAVDGQVKATTNIRVYAKEESVLEGLPAQWVLMDKQGSASDRDALKEAKPEWIASSHYVKSDNQGGAARIEAVNAAGKTAPALNSWGYNDGHIYIKGFYVEDYWLITMPVKNLPQGKTVKVQGSIGGSGSSAAFFLVEYSVDGTNWTACPGAKTWEGTIDESSVTASYHAQAKDSYLASDGAFDVSFSVPSRIDEGNLYVRARVSANVRVTLNNTIATGGGASTRLKGTWKVSVVE